MVDVAAGAADGFKYSPGLIAAAESGLVWDEEKLAVYLRSPKDVIRDGRMPFAGLKKDDEIADVIEYLRADPTP